MFVARSSHNRSRVIVGDRGGWRVLQRNARRVKALKAQEAKNTLMVLE